MKSKVWLDRKNKDLFIKQAKDSGYLSRASFKLLEIENKYKLIVNSTTVLELGSSPGSWTQIIFEKNPKIKLYAFDLLDMKYNHKNLHFIKQRNIIGKYSTSISIATQRFAWKKTCATYCC